jgi:formate-dependent nitrite reductase membrane component NrfD
MAATRYERQHLLPSAGAHPATGAVRVPRGEFMFSYTVQQEWAWLISAAFFFGGVGAGVFVISYFAGYYTGMVVGLAVVAVLKTTAHLLFLGRPLRAWRAVTKWRTSWLSRGVLAIIVFLLAGFVYASPKLGIDVVDKGSAVQEVFGVIAVLGAVVVMIYDGFVLKQSRGIPFWNTYLIPLLTIGYATLAGVTLTLVLQSITLTHAHQGSLEALQITMLVVNLVLVGLYVVAARTRGAAAQVSAAMLTRGRLRALFLLVVGLGLLGTLVFSAIAIAADSVPFQAIGACCDLIADFFIFFAVIRSGVYAPLRPRAGLGPVRY